ncbi:hypothetical protein GGI06_004408 [Coemansia sp. S85]|nr:hypothetical protein GGI06_004408 [Coemansia sp. S85]
MQSVEIGALRCLTLSVNESCAESGILIFAPCASSSDVAATLPVFPADMSIAIWGDADTMLRKWLHFAQLAREQFPLRSADTPCKARLESGAESETAAFPPVTGGCPGETELPPTPAAVGLPVARLS